jgi:hypothetical protein
MGQEQATLKPMVEGIKKNFGDNIFKPSLVLPLTQVFLAKRLCSIYLMKRLML